MPNTPQQATRKNHGRLSGRVVRPQMGGDNQGIWDRFFAGMTIRIISARLATRAERREYEEGTL
jgi:uncharacterized DUF497 family protein